MTEILDDGRIASHVVRSAEDLEVLEAGGARVQFMGANVLYTPEMKRGVLAGEKFGSAPHESGYEHVLADFVVPGSREWHEFLSTRKVVKHPDRDGSGGKIVVTSNIYDKIQKTVEGSGRAVMLTGKRVLPLAQVLTDGDLQSSLGLSSGLLAAMRTLAVTDPDEAARKLQSSVQQAGFEETRVVAGTYSRSRAWARDSIAKWASSKSPASASIRAEVIGVKLLLFSDHENMMPGKSWHVVGPLSAAQQVYQLHKLVAACGPNAVAIALEAELGVLNLDIADGNSYAIPRVTYHVGEGHPGMPTASSMVTMEMLSSAGRLALKEVESKVDEVHIDGVPVASSVRISAKYSLVNNHVLGEGAATIGGEPVVQTRLLAKDLWLVRKETFGLPVAWPLRGVRLGEEVFVCYRGPQGLQVTSPMTVRTTDGVSITMSLVGELGPGLSGGAVVALADMALLGVYEGVGAHVAMATVFSQEMFADVHVAETSSAASRDSARDADDTVYRKFKTRGLGKYIDITMAAVQPLYSRGAHVGLGYTMGPELYTTVDPGVMPLSMGRSAQPLVFEDVGDMRYRAFAGATELSGPVLYRKPNYFEKVAIVGRDEQGPYYSPTTRVVHVGVASRNFSLEGFVEDDTLPYAGGLVVALSDSAVLGQYVRRTTTEALGVVEFCVAVQAKVVSFGSPKVGQSIDRVALVVKAFPMLNPGVWDEDLVEEVFTHSSCQRYRDSSKAFNAGFTPLAYIGDSAIKLAMGMHLRTLGVPSSRWQTYVQRVQSNTAMSKMCRERGLDVGLILPGNVARPPETSKVYADLLEALAGAAYLSETFDTFREFCEALGMSSVVTVLTP